MVKMLFDLNATQPNPSGKRHGGGKYGEIVFKRMLERGINFSCFYDSRKWLNPEIKNMCECANISLFDINDNPIESIIQKNGFTRIFSAIPRNLANLKCCEVYGTIHGLRELEMPFDMFFFKYKHTWKELVKYTIKKFFHSSFKENYHKKFIARYKNSSFHMITVSNHSKYAIYSYFPELKDNKLSVFYSPNTSTNEKLAKITNEKYFMLVSGNRWEKNCLRAIIAFDRMVSSGLIADGIRMKVTGATIKTYKYHIKNIHRFDFLGYVDDSELEKLYANAYAFVYPSLNEGFGYPPIEAMRYGVPVIASPFSSIPEICGGSVLYFNPFSIEEIMNRMLMILDETLHAKYSQNSINQYSKVKLRQDADLDKLIDFILE